MRAALMVLEHECAHQRHALSLSDPDDPCTPDERRDVEKQCHRAADLLEALSSPPETVQDLRTLASKHLSAFVVIHHDQYDKLVVEVPGGKMVFDLTSASMDYRAAWFAIVGMMEVGR